jgi:hypothetical protein
MGPRPFVVKQSDNAVIDLRQVRVDWHFFLFWPFGRPFEPAFPGEILSLIARLQAPPAPA